jgi:hypothetical protein
MCRAKTTSLRSFSTPLIPCEQVFSSVKKLITSERNQLEEDIIEACECLKTWWRNSLIELQFGHFKKQK